MDYDEKIKRTVDQKNDDRVLGSLFRGLLHFVDECIVVARRRRAY
jgi:hypothetical protein